MDLEKLEIKMNTQFTEVCGEIADLRREMKERDTWLRHEMKPGYYRLVFSVGGIVILGFGVMAAIVKYWEIIPIS